MKSYDARAVNLAFLKALGLEHDANSIMGVEVDIRPDDFPRVTVLRRCTDAEFGTSLDEFELVPRTKPEEGK